MKYTNELKELVVLVVVVGSYSTSTVVDLTPRD